MWVRITLLLGSVLVLLVVHGVHDAKTLTKSDGHDLLRTKYAKKTSNYSPNAADFGNNQDSPFNEVLNYHRKKRRPRRSIRKKLAHREADHDHSSYYEIKRHKRRHKHLLREIYFLNSTEPLVSDLAPRAEDKSKAKNRIVSDLRNHIERRKRYSYMTKDGVVHYAYEVVVPCSGWAQYEPYRCVPCQCTRETCRRTCENVDQRKFAKPFPIPYSTQKPTWVKFEYDTPTQKTPPIYSGPGKNWVGPRIGCNCSPRGSEISTCDITTGQCRCKPFYVGRTCDKCQDGYWESINGCVKCECDVDGSRAKLCNQRTGQCDCKPGVGGLRCDTCSSNFYGFSVEGCKACEPCDKKGHVCDPDTGRCICPPYSHGEFCHICSTNTWGYEPNKGCKACNCSNSGSTKMQCNLNTGQCNCRLGYAGFHCDRCDHGYFGYPRCRRCNCNVIGSDKYKAKCDKEGICQCNEDGTCPCKANVVGRKCDECKEGTFGLQLDNPDGCTQCFCFGRSSKCTEAGLTWGQMRTNSSRSLMATAEKQRQSELEVSEKLLVIPGTHGNVSVGQYRFDAPLYWKLHPTFNGDRILSYGGYIRFRADTHDSKQRLPQEVLNHYPLVQLRGQGRIVLEYYPPLPIKGDKYEIRLHESLWKRIYPKDTHLTPRELLMVALQNVQNIFVKATDSAVFEKLVLQDVIIDTAIEIPGNPPPLAKGVEVCDCPRQYNSSSCQDPSVGFFRYYTPTSVNGTILIDTFIGQVKPCECNGRSTVCDRETGYCMHCKFNTDGRYCEQCAEGYYGNPMIPFGTCEPCPCPSITQNFAKECKPLSKPSQFKCECKSGYSGPKCDKCSSGYYGQPHIPGGSCQPCNCNLEGRASDECDSETGQCNCKPGVVGKQCSECEKPRHVLEQFKCTPCDKCTQWLLDDVELLSNDLHRNTNFLQIGAIEPPWSSLNRLEDRYQYLNDKLASYLEDRALAEELITNATVNDLGHRLYAMEDKLNQMQPETVIQNGKDLLVDAQEVADDIGRNKNKLEELIETLQNFGKSHVTTKEALKQAHELFNQIKEISDRMKFNHREALKKCKNVKSLVEILMIGPSLDPKELHKQLDNLGDRVKDLERLLNDIAMTIQETEIKNKWNELSITDLNNTLLKLRRIENSMNEDLLQANKSIISTFKVLNDTDRNYELILESDLDELLQKLDEKDKELSLFDSDLYLKPILYHVQKLEENATEYAKLFNLSSKEIDAVRASEAYAKIKQFVEEAERAAKEAIDSVHSALDTLSPEGKDSLYVNVTISGADSERLGIRVKHQRENLAAIIQRKDNLSHQLNIVDSNIWKNGLKNRDQDNIIRDTKDNLDYINLHKIGRLRNITKDITDKTSAIKDLHRTVMDLKTSKQYEIDKPLEKLLNLTTSDKLKKLQEQIILTKHELKAIFAQSTHLDAIKKHAASYSTVKKMSNSISNKLDQLKAKIAKAKKTADGLRISLSGPTCSRSYALGNLSPRLINQLTVKFNYTMPSEKQLLNYSLFNLQTETGQFMNVKITDSILEFEWKLGSKANHLRFELIQNDFYTVDIKRIGGYVKMTVNGVTKHHSSENEFENGSSIFAVVPSNLLHVGGSNNSQSGIPGCIRDIIFDEVPVGLWNFHNSTGVCTACIRSNELTLESTYDFYTGNGYSVISKEQQERDANPAKFNVQFSLRTFDENALLFLAADLERRNYIAVTMHEGYVQYEVHYSKHKSIILTSKQKCNNGEKVRISAEKLHIKSKLTDTAVLKINEEEQGRERRESISGPSIFRLKKVDYYFGGVPPGYILQSNGTSASLHTHASLLGGLEELKEYQLFNDDNIRKYGVVKKSGELQFSKVLFEGQGHVEIKTPQIRTKLQFLLRTKESDVFVMLINASSTRFFISKGRINVDFDYHNNVPLTSIVSINDDRYHLIELIQGEKVILRINGTEQDSAAYTKNKTSTITDSTALYLGGIPDSLLGGLERTQPELFSGTISDIIIDNKIIYFDKTTIQTFKHVKIGRDGFLPTKIPTNFEKPTNDDHITLHSDGGPFNMKEMQNTEGCGKPLNYTFDTSAAKFGDKLHSHVVHFLKESFWKKDYTLELQFRTMQPKGLLFLAYGARQHFNLLEIRDGKILYRANGKRQKEIMLPQKVDDGNWYNVIVDVSGIKKRRKLIIAINGYQTKPLRPPKNKVQRELYIGGYPENITLPSIIRTELHPFRGCLRSFKINKIPQSLVRDKNTIHYNIGQCFPNIESGSYFGGAAYAIYNQYFHIDKVLELSLEFRTSEQNGILISISNPRNSPALSVELQNGAIVMTIDNGYGSITNVTNNLSDFALCNNQWHNITALYTSTEITINVDGIIKIWVQPDDDTLIDELEAPLYIGGLPDYAPVGTLKMKENFKGCIRNLKIGGKTSNWVEMQKITNILLDSCPMVS